MRLCVILAVLVQSSAATAAPTVDLPLQGFPGLRIGMEANAALQAYRVTYPAMARAKNQEFSTLEVFTDKASGTGIFICKGELVAIHRTDYGSVEVFGEKVTALIGNGATSIRDVVTKHARGGTNVYAIRLTVPGDDAGVAIVTAIGPIDTGEYGVTIGLSKVHSCG